jgi:cytoskeletal protein RodZ
VADKKNSRIDKYEKRRKNTKSISILFVAAGVMIILLIGIGIFGGGNDQNSASEFVISNPESTESQPSVQAESASTEKDETEDSENDQGRNEENEKEQDKEKEEKEESNKDIELEESEPTDGHAVEAYTADWEPIGTEQEGPHTTDYSDGSQDRIEIKRAVSEVTGLDPDNMTEHWVGNGGDQKVVATVSNGEQTEIYRVFLSWVDGEGWQPIQLEVLDDVVY